MLTKSIYRIVASANRKVCPWHAENPHWIGPGTTQHAQVWQYSRPIKRRLPITSRFARVDELCQYGFNLLSTSAPPSVSHPAFGWGLRFPVMWLSNNSPQNRGLNPLDSSFSLMSKPVWGSLNWKHASLDKFAQFSRINARIKIQFVLNASFQS